MSAWSLAFADWLGRPSIRLAILVAALPRSTERTARLVGTRAAIRFGPELIGRIVDLTLRVHRKFTEGLLSDISKPLLLL
jgi:hypothetical protein